MYRFPKGYLYVFEELYTFVKYLRAKMWELFLKNCALLIMIYS